MRKIINILFFVSIAIFSAMAKDVYSPDEVPNVNLKDHTKYVSDPEGYLSSSAQAQTDSILWHLRQQTTAEAVAVIIPSTGDLTIEEFTEELFRKWGIGKKDKDNGVLLLIAVNDRAARIETGYGVEGALPDITAKKIITKAIAPNIVNGNIDKAVTESTSLISQVLSDPEVAEEIRSNQLDNFGGIEKPQVAQFIKYLATGVFLLAFLFFMVLLIRNRKKNNYFKAQIWRENLNVFIVASIFSFGTAIIFLILAWLLFKRYRNRKIKCDTCGAKMNKLSEEEDNSLLNPAQDLEEKLNTVDYDVWVCPDCGTVERFPFKQRQSRFIECEKCGTIASELICNKIITRATTRNPGKGVKIYQCRFCGHQTQKPYTIPQKETPVIVPIIGGGHGGSGGFGGGFGGGASGGGGATGRW